MGVCGCSEVHDVQLVAKVANGFVVVDRYWGCNYCETPISVNVTFWSDEMAKNHDVIPTIDLTQFDTEFTADLALVIISDQQGLFGAMQQQRHKLCEDDLFYVEEAGLSILQNAMSETLARHPLLTKGKMTLN